MSTIESLMHDELGEIAVLWPQFTKYVDESKEGWIKTLNDSETNPYHRLTVELPDHVTSLMVHDEDGSIERYILRSMISECLGLKIWIRSGEGENFTLFLRKET